MSSASLYRRMAATFIKCAKDSNTASERDQFIAGAIHYQQLSQTFEDQHRPEPDNEKTSHTACAV